MDVLSEIFSSIHIDGSALAEMRCGGEWGVDMVPGDGIIFHYIIEGQCWLLSEDKPVKLSAGDLVVGIHWPSHALASSPESPLQTAWDLVTSSGLEFWTGSTLSRPNVLYPGTQNCDTLTLCGLFALKGRGAKVLIDQLPAIIHLGGQDLGLAPQLKTALDFIHQESQVARPGYVAVASRLMDLLLIQILRSAVEHPKVRIGLLAGLADENISRALAAIHASPSTSWTVATLAKEAYLSRTTFAERFKKMVGITPIQYVVRWRMTIAEELLSESNMTIEQIRNRLGYESSFVFARAFRAHSGLAPREYRRATEADNRR